eukprot:5232282-Pyramimonas_sp.AAC.1
MRRRNRRSWRRRTSVNPSAIKDAEMNPSSKLPLHCPHTFSFPLRGLPRWKNSLKTLKNAKTLFSGFQRRGST